MTSIAITGASGKLARLVAGSLHAKSHNKLILLSRTPQTVPNTFGDSVVRHADFDTPGTLSESFAGIDRLVLISTDVLDGSGRRVNQLRAAIDAAVEAGVRHIVYTSFYKADAEPLAAMGADHLGTERMLKACGIGYTILRNAFYDDLAHQLIARADPAGTIVHAIGGSGVAYVTRQQCADAAAFAASDGLDGTRVFDITGPKAITMPELAQLASARYARPYAAVSVSADELVAGLCTACVPQATAAMLAWIDSGLAAGAMEPASHDFERLTGRAAPAFAL